MTELAPDVTVQRLVGALDPARRLVTLRVEERLASDPEARWERRGGFSFPSACIPDAVSILEELAGKSPAPVPAPPPPSLSAQDRDLLERLNLPLAR